MVRTAAVGGSCQQKTLFKFAQEMSGLVNYVLKKLREDQVQMADYALKSAGEREVGAAPAGPLP